MKIGVPRALLYHRYKNLWKTFFAELGCEILVSEKTNKKILADGINYSIDESCLPAKIFMGHVYSLKDKCDYILVPRIESYGKGDDVCVKFNAIYDIVNNTFDMKLLDYNINVKNGQTEKKGFIKMGKNLGYSYFKTLKAYKKAKEAYELANRQKVTMQETKLNSDGPKILIASHQYNTYDKLIGHPIADFIKKLGGVPLYADAVDISESIARSKELSGSLYWKYNKEMIGAIKLLEDKVDGIILLTAFPCGPDSLVNELIIRKSKKVPIINIIIDELQGEAGLQTRIESFMDILLSKRGM
jgi:predicted nucleotide-binding protein (sugar kinase/HSP70/actin superfamily)